MFQSPYRELIGADKSGHKGATRRLSGAFVVSATNAVNHVQFTRWARPSGRFAVLICQSGYADSSAPGYHLKLSALRRFRLGAVLRIALQLARDPVWRGFVNRDLPAALNFRGRETSFPGAGDVTGI